MLEGDFVLSTKKVNLNPYEDALYSNPMHYRPDAVSGHLITPFKEWAAGGISPWWKAFTNLKHDRMSNFREAKLRNVLHSLAAVFIIVSLHNENEFKAGSVPVELYDLFFPKYWTFRGRVSVMNHYKEYLAAAVLAGGNLKFFAHTITSGLTIRPEPCFSLLTAPFLNPDISDAEA